MSTKGYNGRDFKVELDGTLIAAIQTKSTTMNREAVDVTTDDSDGWRTLLPEPGVRSVDQSIEGVVTSANVSVITDEWEGNVLSDITIVGPDGREMTAADGFFLGNVEMSGEQDGHVAFTAELQSSGEVTIVTPGQ